MPVPHVAFRASPELTAATQQYIERLSAPNCRPEPQLLAEVMDRFTHDSVHALITDPLDRLGVHGTQRRVADFVAETVEKSTHVVMKATVNKLDLDQHKRCAEYMDAMRLKLPVAGKADGEWYVAFPAPQAFADRARASMNRSRTVGPRGEVNETSEIMKTLTDLAIDNYYERPIALLKFGMILRKVTQVAISGVHKASHSAINHLFPKLTDEQLIKGVDYFDGLLIDVQQADLRTPIKL